MRSSDQCSKRSGWAKTCVESMRHRMKTVTARRHVKAWEMRTNASRIATNGAESLPAACRSAINGAAPLFWVGFDYPRGRRKYNSLTMNMAKVGVDAPGHRWER